MHGPPSHSAFLTSTYENRTPYNLKSWTRLEPVRKCLQYRSSVFAFIGCGCGVWVWGVGCGVWGVGCGVGWGVGYMVRC